MAVVQEVALSLSLSIDVVVIYEAEDDVARSIEEIEKNLKDGEEVNSNLLKGKYHIGVTSGGHFPSCSLSHSTYLGIYIFV